MISLIKYYVFICVKVVSEQSYVEAFERLNLELWYRWQIIIYKNYKISLDKYGKLRTYPL